MAGRERFQPRPKDPLPAPESYERKSCGPNPERPGLTAMGTLKEPVPSAGLAANFSPMPRIAPPPLGSDNAGAEKRSSFGSLVFAGSCEFMTLTLNLELEN